LDLHGIAVPIALIWYWFTFRLLILTQNGPRAMWLVGRSARLG